MAFTAEELAKLKALQAAADKKAEDELHEKYFNKTFWDVMKDRLRGVAGGFWIGVLQGGAVGLAFGAVLAVALPLILPAGILAGVTAPMIILGSTAAFAAGGAKFGMDVGADVGANAGAISSGLAQMEVRMRALGRAQNAPALNPLQEAGVKEALKQVEAPKKEKERIFIWKSAAIWGALGSIMGGLMTSAAIAAKGMPFAIGALEAVIGEAAVAALAAPAIPIALTLLAAVGMGLAGMSFGVSRSVYKRMVASTDHLVNGTVGAHMFRDLFGKSKEQQPEVALPFKTADMMLAGNTPAAPAVTADDMALLNARTAAKPDFATRAQQATPPLQIS